MIVLIEVSRCVLLENLSKLPSSIINHPPKGIHLSSLIFCLFFCLLSSIRDPAFFCFQLPLILNFIFHSLFRLLLFFIFGGDMARDDDDVFERGESKSNQLPSTPTRLSPAQTPKRNRAHARGLWETRPR